MYNFFQETPDATPDATPDSTPGCSPDYIGLPSVPDSLNFLRSQPSSVEPNLENEGIKLEFEQEPEELCDRRTEKELAAGKHGQIGAKIEEALSNGVQLKDKKKINKKKPFPSVKLKNYHRGEQALISVTAMTIKKNKKIGKKCENKQVQLQRELAELLEENQDSNNEILPFVKYDKKYYLHPIRLIKGNRKTNLPICEEILDSIDVIAKKEKDFLVYLEASIMTVDDNSRFKRYDMKLARKEFELNIMYLRFDAYEYTNNVKGDRLCPPLYSKAIRNKNSTETNELHISEMMPIVGKPAGGTYFFLFCKAVCPGIKIRFCQKNDLGKIVWEHNDKVKVLRNSHCIVGVTPKYGGKKGKVIVQLFRPSDGALSNEVEFTYDPNQNSLTEPKIFSCDPEINSSCIEILERSESVNAASKSSDVETPDRSESVNTVSKSSDVEIPDRSESVNIASKSSDIETPDRSESVNTASKSSDIEMPDRSESVNAASKSSDVEIPDRNESDNIASKSSDVEIPDRNESDNIASKSSDIKILESSASVNAGNESSDIEMTEPNELGNTLNKSIDTDSNFGKEDIKMNNCNNDDIEINSTNTYSTDFNVWRGWTFDEPMGLEEMLTYISDMDSPNTISDSSYIGPVKDDLNDFIDKY